MKISFRRLAYDIFFRFSPILIVILLELSLRFLGIGESYELFSKSGDGLYYELNQNYYRRFMSAKQFPDVDIYPQKFPVHKPENTYRIFLIGDQTLCSYFPGANQTPLIDDFSDEQGKHYDIIQLAVPYTNSFALKRLAGDIKKYDVDACVIITGGNEFYGIPRKSSWMKDIDNYWGLGLYVTMKNNRFMQVLEKFVYLQKEPQTEFPPKDIDDWTIPYASDIFKESLTYLERNLKSISEKADYPVLMIAMPVNIVSTPYRSLFVDKELKDEDFTRECEVLVDNADRFTIERWITELEAWEPNTSVFYYCKAMIAEHENEHENALDYYEKALELDAFRVRMNRDIYNIILEQSHAAKIEIIDLLSSMNAVTDGGLHIDRYFVNGIQLNESGKEMVLNRIRSSIKTFFEQ